MLTLQILRKIGPMLTCCLGTSMVLANPVENVYVQTRGGGRLSQSEASRPSDELDELPPEELRLREMAAQRCAEELYREGEFADATRAASQVVALRKRLFGENHPRYATSLNNLGQLLRLQAQYREAETAFEKAAEILKATSGEAHPECALTMNNQGVLYIDMSDYTRAESLLGKSAE